MTRSAMVLMSPTTKFLINIVMWNLLRKRSKLVKTSKLFRPYGTQSHLPIIGQALVELQAENGAKIKTWVYVVNDKQEQCLLGSNDAERLGIVTINLKGAQAEVVNCITPV